MIDKVRDQASAASVDPDFPIHPENGPAVRLFSALRSQWRVVSLSTMGRAEWRKIGLDYAAIEPTARLRGIEITPDDFARLQLLEGEALTAWAEERASQ